MGFLVFLVNFTPFDSSYSALSEARDGAILEDEETSDWRIVLVGKWTEFFFAGCGIDQGCHPKARCSIRGKHGKVWNVLQGPLGNHPYSDGLPQFCPKWSSTNRHVFCMHVESKFGPRKVARMHDHVSLTYKVSAWFWIFFFVSPEFLLASLIFVEILLLISDRCRCIRFKIIRF